MPARGGVAWALLRRQGREGCPFLSGRPSRAAHWGTNAKPPPPPITLTRGPNTDDHRYAPLRSGQKRGGGATNPAPPSSRKGLAVSRRSGSLVPERMTTEALWHRVDGLIARSYWAADNTPRERDRLLDELRLVIRELRHRGEQLRLP